MSTPSNQPSDGFSVDPAEPVWRKALGIGVVCAIAGAVFIWVSGHLPGSREPDERLAVAECWDAIEQNQSSGSLLHDMRVACQRMESSRLIAAGE